MKKSKKKEKPTVNSKLEGFEIQIDSFGEIKSNLDIEKINQFLDEEVEDKKLINRKDNNKEEDQE